METLYYPDDDILVLKLSNAPIVKEISQDWNVNVSYDDDGNIVEMVVLDAKASGLYPVHAEEPQTA